MIRTFNIKNSTLILKTGDLTKEPVDAIVNAANSRLAGGGGVDGAIHAAAGPELLKACQVIVANKGYLQPGHAVATEGFRLPAKYVIHTVGPIWGGGHNKEDQTLVNAYTNSLKTAVELNAETVAFPAISCGVYGFPLERAANLAAATIVDFLGTGKLKQVSMVVTSEEAFAVWEQAMEQALEDSE